VGNRTEQQVKEASEGRKYKAEAAKPSTRKKKAAKKYAKIKYKPSKKKKGRR
jgi:hypothetical protein